ncbi:hypothetical protein EAS68_12695 [Legionella jordanis]|uniref:tetratricopeptide repeat protein n=1 Tax=Legionella jordanis TaxID=456 RepID=UPI000EFE7570|nr:tetratricopeptide repeat protein [Legionella jordanis]RMX15333.1 hypothetical protein EAS68_12695 [Legionella jordanis]
MFRNKILFVVFIFITISIVFVYVAIKQAKNLQRDTKALMEKYYLLNKTDKAAAKRTLLIILSQEKQNIAALKELTNLYLREKNFKSALPLLQTIAQLEPNEKQLFRLANVYYEIGQWEKAYSIFNPLTQQSENYTIKHQSLLMLDRMNSFISNYKTNSTAAITGHENAPNINQIFLSWFYTLKNEQPERADILLPLLYTLDFKNPILNQEMGFLELRRNHSKKALQFFLQAFQDKPTDQSALQIAYLYMQLGDKANAAHYFLIASQSNIKETKLAALRGLDYSILAQSSETYPQQLKDKFGNQFKFATRDKILLDRFYSLKKKDKALAWKLIKQIILEYPLNILALKEGGYLALELHHSTEAIEYFTRVYHLTSEPDIALQLGYLYDQSSNKYLAYQYFKLATLNPDKEQELKAQNALTNLAGLQTKFLPSPYFGEIFFTPFTQSRFGLTVRPFISRFGVELNDSWQTKTYLVFRQTDDNKSTNSGQIPQIYEDNVRILGVGALTYPFNNFPLVIWAEGGEAYDLVFRNRERWRGDLRGGLMYYNEFGVRPAYYPTLRISPDYYSSLYGDITYFSRYDNNVIGTFRTHQGIHLAQYKSTMVNVYASARIIEDSRREFFNNIAEVGPGIGIIPSNRFRLELRFEYIKGVYLPAGGSVNPYGKYYTNKLAQLLFYVKV